MYVDNSFMKGDITMKRLCFGSLLIILYQARNNSVTNDKLCNAIFSAYEIDKELYGSTSGHLKNGHDNLPKGLVDKVSSLPFEMVDKNFQDKIVPYIKDCKKESIVRAIKDILREDNTINKKTIVGYVSGYEKEKIITMSTFSFSALLSSVFYYAITKVSNKECRNEIKEIEKDYVSSFDNSSEKIFFESSNAPIKSPLIKTVNDSSFDRIFEKIHKLTVSNLAAPSTVELYSVDIANMNFNFKNAKDFILDNIGSYVMSRTKITSYEEQRKLIAAGARALSKYSNSFKKSQDSILGETLLYIFLEQVLNAPKIMSKIELDDNGHSKSDGIYLLHSDLRGLPFTQLVFGASNIVGNLEMAVDSVFEKVDSIRENNDEELLMIDTTLNSNIFDKDVNQYLENIIKPKKTERVSTEMAFGCFLGYTLSIDKSKCLKSEYIQLAKDQMKRDIDNIKIYIEDRIKEKQLNGYNFYFYILPFNDADNEKINIVKSMTGVS